MAPPGVMPIQMPTSELRTDVTQYLGSSFQLRALVHAVQVQVFNHQIQRFADGLGLQDPEIIGQGDKQKAQKEVPTVSPKIFVQVS